MSDSSSKEQGSVNKQVFEKQTPYVTDPTPLDTSGSREINPFTRIHRGEDTIVNEGEDGERVTFSDFRPTPLPSGTPEPAPKDSSAQGRASSRDFRPTPVQQTSDSSVDLAPATKKGTSTAAGKEDGKPNPTAS